VTWRLSLAGSLGWLLACASNQQIATIEPLPPSPEPSTNTGTSDVPAATQAETKSTDKSNKRSASAEDTAFVLSREPANKATGGAEVDWIHVADKWWKFRADFIKLSEDDLRARDEAIAGDVAPEGFWDRQTAVETALIWTSLCNECHGGRRKVEDAINMPVPPPSWGRGQGLFFGQRRGYKDVFGKVYNGGGPPKEDGKRPMPPWRGKLAREEIWALLYFLEYQSGGIEGRFPPSLYPRMPADFPAGD
jgi:hypothetical protein